MEHSPVARTRFRDNTPQMRNARRQRPFKTLGKRIESTGAGVNNPRHEVRDDLAGKSVRIRAVQIGFMAPPRGRPSVIDVAFRADDLTYVVRIFRKLLTQSFDKSRKRPLA